MAKRFTEQVALITGGSRGIGKGEAKKFAEEGAKIAIIDVNEEALQETEKEFKEHGFTVFTKVANVAEAEEVESAVEDIAQIFGSLDILVNNAGVIRDNMVFKMTDD